MYRCDECLYDCDYGICSTAKSCKECGNITDTDTEVDVCKCLTVNPENCPYFIKRNTDGESYEQN